MLPLLLAATLTLPVIIDTDSGVDDMMAIAYLLAQPEIKIEAITISNGLAHVDKGAQNVIRLLEQAGRPQIPVYIGRDKPLSGNAEFPDCLSFAKNGRHCDATITFDRAARDLPGCVYFNRAMRIDI